MIPDPRERDLLTEMISFGISVIGRVPFASRSSRWIGHSIGKSFPLIRGLVLIQGLAHNFITTAFALARPALGLVVNLADCPALN